MREKLEDEEDDDDFIYPNPSENIIYQDSWYRWIIILVYFFQALVNFQIYTFTSSIVTTLQKVYDVSLIKIALISLWYNMLYLPATLIANPVIEKYGAKVSLIIGAIGNFACIWLRLLINYDFWWLIISGIMGGIASPFILNTITNLSCAWFSTKQRQLATSIGILANPIGCAWGFAFPLLFINESEAKADKETGKQQVWNACLYLAIITTVILLGTFLIMNNPKYPPSPAGDPNTKRLDIKEGMREVSSNYSAIVLVVIVGYNMGNAEAYDIMFNAFLEPFGITSKETMYLGIAFVFTGVASTILFSVYISRTLNYKGTLILCFIMTIFCNLPTKNISFVVSVGWIAVAFTGKLWLIFLALALTGIFFSPINPIGQELGCEICFPVPESIVSGLIFSSNRIFASINVCIAALFLEGGSKERVLYFVIIIAVFYIVCAILIITIKQNLKRTKYDQEHKIIAIQNEDDNIPLLS